MRIKLSTILWKKWKIVEIYHFYLTKRRNYYYNNVDLCLEVELVKRTYQPNNRKKSKKLGFFARKKTNILNRRRRKGRKVLSK
jgi:ribosomal protein L34